MWPAKPWKHIHIDFAGPFLGKNFLVVVDAHSKWAEVIEMSSTTSSKTIVELRKLFSAYGLPEQIVSDNGPQFVAEEFATFLKLNGIRHIRCSPYHPSSNGGAERFIQTFKQAMKAGATSTPLFSQRLSSFLLTYRATPHATTNTPPCELFIGRRIRTLFDLLLPSQEKRVNDRQAAQKAGHDMHVQSRQFEIDQLVMARNWRDGPDWVPGVLIEKLGPLTYKVQTQAGQIWKRHVDHLKGLGRTDCPPVSTDSDDSVNFPAPSATTESQNDAESITDTITDTDDTTRTHSDTAKRYPRRDCKSPERLM